LRRTKIVVLTSDRLDLPPPEAENTTNKPLIHPAQYTLEKEVILLNEDSWSALNDVDDKPVSVKPDSPEQRENSSSPGENPNPLWSEFKNRKAQTILREKERIEAESAKQQQLKALEEAEKQRIEDKRKQDFLQIQKEKEEKEREIQRLREAERRKRARDAQSVNFTSQSQIMASIEKSFNHYDASSLAHPEATLMGLSRTEGDEVL